MRRSLTVSCTGLAGRTSARTCASTSEASQSPDAVPLAASQRLQKVVALKINLKDDRVYAAAGPGRESSVPFTAGCVQPPLSPNPRTGAP